MLQMVLFFSPFVTLTDYPVSCCSCFQKVLSAGSYDISKNTQLCPMDYICIGVGRWEKPLCLAVPL